MNEPKDPVYIENWFTLYKKSPYPFHPYRDIFTKEDQALKQIEFFKRNAQQQILQQLTGISEYEDKKLKKFQTEVHFCKEMKRVFEELQTIVNMIAEEHLINCRNMKNIKVGVAEQCKHLPECLQKYKMITDKNQKIIKICEGYHIDRSSKPPKLMLGKATGTRNLPPTFRQIIEVIEPLKIMYTSIEEKYEDQFKKRAFDLSNWLNAWSKPHVEREARLSGYIKYVKKLLKDDYICIYEIAGEEGKYGKQPIRIRQDSPFRQQVIDDTKKCEDLIKEIKIIGEKQEEYILKGKNEAIKKILTNPIMMQSGLSKEFGNLSSCKLFKGLTYHVWFKYQIKDQLHPTENETDDGFIDNQLRAFRGFARFLQLRFVKKGKANYLNICAISKAVKNPDSDPEVFDFKENTKLDDENFMFFRLTNNTNFTVGKVTDNHEFSIIFNEKNENNINEELVGDNLEKYGLFHCHKNNLKDGSNSESYVKSFQLIFDFWSQKDEDREMFNQYIGSEGNKRVKKDAQDAIVKSKAFADLLENCIFAKLQNSEERSTNLTMAKAFNGFTEEELEDLQIPDFANKPAETGETKEDFEQKLTGNVKNWAVNVPSHFHISKDSSSQDMSSSYHWKNFNIGLAHDSQTGLLFFSDFLRKTTDEMNPKSLEKLMVENYLLQTEYDWEDKLIDRIFHPKYFKNHAIYFGNCQILDKLDFDAMNNVGKNSNEIKDSGSKSIMNKLGALSTFRSTAGKRRTKNKKGPRDGAEIKMQHFFKTYPTDKIEKWHCPKYVAIYVDPWALNLDIMIFDKLNEVRPILKFRIFDKGQRKTSDDVIDTFNICYASQNSDNSFQLPNVTKYEVDNYGGLRDKGKEEENVLLFINRKFRDNFVRSLEEACQEIVRLIQKREGEGSEVNVIVKNESIYREESSESEAELEEVLADQNNVVEEQQEVVEEEPIITSSYVANPLLSELNAFHDRMKERASVRGRLQLED